VSTFKAAMDQELINLNKEFKELVGEPMDLGGNPFGVPPVLDLRGDPFENPPAVPDFGAPVSTLPDLGPLPELSIFKLNADCSNAPLEGTPLPGALIYKNNNIVDPKRIGLALAYARGFQRIPAHILTCEERVLDEEMAKLSMNPVVGQPNPPNHPIQGDRFQETSRERNRRRNQAKRKKAKRVKPGSNPGPGQARQPRQHGLPTDTRLLNRIRFLESQLKEERGAVQKEKAVTRQAYEDVNRLTRELGKAKADLVRVTADLERVRANRDDILKKLNKSGEEFSGGKLLLSVNENSIISGPAPSRAAPAALGRPPISPSWAVGPFL